jgi:hypothetical protein
VNQQEKAAKKQQERDEWFQKLLQEVKKEAEENEPWNFDSDWRNNPDNYSLILAEGDDASNFSNYSFYEKDTGMLVLIEDDAEASAIVKQMLQAGISVVSAIPQRPEAA